MSLRDLKVGDEVFVVHQSRLSGRERRTGIGTIARVGRKYAYVNAYSLRESPFCRDTGCSVHPPDTNARANQCGFDVYRNEAEYRAEVHAVKEYERLQTRICSRFHGLKKLPPDVVGAIHAILDAAPGLSEQQNKESE